ncbi:MAG: signal peptidase I [Lysobacteraceae bacterium]|jgi:signal peptidase I|nr:MAG: signal peptidase I [Xanthomonadaceae bacterium]
MVWFETILVVLTLLTGIVWLLDKLFLAKRRAARGGLLDEEPVLVDYSRAFFPVLALVLVLRSFIAEPYKIPSASMMPNLLIGDFILVNKFSYGLRLPINNHKFVALGEPKRGEVVVFKPPHDPENNWIKRVIGLPGDRISFQGNALTINGQPVAYQTLGSYNGRGVAPGTEGAALLQEDLPGRTHTVLEGLDNIVGQGEWEVPAGHYFVMGDNRDNSEDGRLWPEFDRNGQLLPNHNFLPEQNLRGKAFLIWLNCEGWFCKDGFSASRIGTKIE